MAAQIQILSKWKSVPDDLRARIRAFKPRSNLGQLVKDCFGYLPPDLAAELLTSITSCAVLESSLSGVVVRHPDSVWREGRPRTRAGFKSFDQLYLLHKRLSEALRAGRVREAHRVEMEIYRHSLEARLIENHGVISRRVITNNGVAALVDAYQNTVEPETFKYHGLGTGTNAEAAGDSALQTELSTQYNPNSTRATGTTTETSSNIFETVATNTVDGSAAVTEHGLLTQAATGGGTLMDRSVFSAINLVSGDGLQSTYDQTLTAGG